MEKTRQKNHRGGGGVVADCDRDSSAESFSFGMSFKLPQPKKPDFEFGGAPPSYLTMDTTQDTPADVLFHNGRLVPHTYHCSSQKESDVSQLSSSRTSSMNSKDSASRSNSNSSSSSGSSRYNAARRTSVQRVNKQSAGARTLKKAGNDVDEFELHPPRPGVELSFRYRNTDELARKDEKKKNDDSWFGLKIFQSFTAACRECHALEPSSVKPGVVRQNARSN